MIENLLEEHACTILEEGTVCLLQSSKKPSSVSQESELRLKLLEKSLSDSLLRVLREAYEALRDGTYTEQNRFETNIAILTSYISVMWSELFPEMYVSEILKLKPIKQIIPNVNNNSIKWAENFGDESPILRLPFPLDDKGEKFKIIFSSLQGYVIIPATSPDMRKGDKSRIFWQCAKRITKTCNTMGLKTLVLNPEEYKDVPTICSTVDTFSLCFIEAKYIQGGGKPIPEYCVVHRVKGIYSLANKCILIRTLRNLDRKHLFSALDGDKTFSSKSFLPPSSMICFDSLSNVLELIDSNPGVFMLKPGGGAMGSGIIILRCHEPNKSKVLLLQTLESYFKSYTHEDLVLQKYIEAPMIIDKRKSDLRVFILLVVTGKTGSNKGGVHAFVHPGYVKLSAIPFDLQDKKRETHLTNLSVQIRSKHYLKIKDTLTWFPDELNNYINKRYSGGKFDCARGLNWARDCLYPKICAIIGYCMAAALPSINSLKNVNDFEILAADLIVDNQMNVYLLEIQSGPGLSMNSPALQGTISSMIEESHCIVGEVFQRTKRSMPIRNLVCLENFRYVYSSDDADILAYWVENFYLDPKPRCCRTKSDESGQHSKINSDDAAVSP